MKPLTKTVAPAVLKLIAEIDEFKGSWKYMSFLTPDVLNNLRKVATIESIGASTRIEGSKLSDSEVAQLLNGVSPYSFHSRDEEEVAGYAELMNTIFDSYRDIDISENIIKHLHSILLKYSSKDVRHSGEYKKLPNDVVAIGDNGKQLGVVFQTASPFETPFKMEQLVDDLVNETNAMKNHPLVFIAAFIVHFLAIHPFQDGNGRLSRALTALLLLKSGYAHVPYASIEAVIETNKKDYYIALRESQKTFGSANPSIEAWLLFFLRALKNQKDVLIRKIEKENSIIDLPALSLEILELAKLTGRLTMAKAVAGTKGKERTIHDHIQKLVVKGYLIKHGDRKATYYTSAL